MARSLRGKLSKGRFKCFTPLFTLASPPGAIAGAAAKCSSLQLEDDLRDDGEANPGPSVELGLLGDCGCPGCKIDCIEKWSDLKDMESVLLSKALRQYRNIAHCYNPFYYLNPDSKASLMIVIPSTSDFFAIGHIVGNETTDLIIFDAVLGLYKTFRLRKSVDSIKADLLSQSPLADYLAKESGVRLRRLHDVMLFGRLKKEFAATIEVDRPMSQEETAQWDALKRMPADNFSASRQALADFIGNITAYDGGPCWFQLLTDYWKAMQYEYCLVGEIRCREAETARQELTAEVVEVIDMWRAQRPEVGSYSYGIARRIASFLRLVPLLYAAKRLDDKQMKQVEACVLATSTNNKTATSLCRSLNLPESTSLRIYVTKAGDVVTQKHQMAPADEGEAACVVIDLDRKKAFCIRKTHGIDLTTERLRMFVLWIHRQMPTAMITVRDWDREQARTRLKNFNRSNPRIVQSLSVCLQDFAHTHWYLFPGGFVPSGRNLPTSAVQDVQALPPIYRGM